MTATGILVAIACLGAGFAIAWAWANHFSRRWRGLELEKRAAGLESTVQEVKKQNDPLQQDLRLSKKRNGRGTEVACLR